MVTCGNASVGKVLSIQCTDLSSDPHYPHTYMGTVVPSSNLSFESMEKCGSGIYWTTTLAGLGHIPDSVRDPFSKKKKDKVETKTSTSTFIHAHRCIPHKCIFMSHMCTPMYT